MFTLKIILTSLVVLIVQIAQADFEPPMFPLEIQDTNLLCMAETAKGSVTIMRNEERYRIVVYEYRINYSAEYVVVPNNSTYVGQQLAKVPGTNTGEATMPETLWLDSIQGLADDFYILYDLKESPIQFSKYYGCAPQPVNNI